MIIHDITHLIIHFYLIIHDNYYTSCTFSQVNAGTTPTRAVDNEQERKLVEDITTPGGIRVAPPKEDLVRFISR